MKKPGAILAAMTRRIVTCLLFAMWFVSGVVMMYVAFPQLTTRERLATCCHRCVQIRSKAAAGMTYVP